MTPEMRPWELWGISEADWQEGWRRTLEQAVEAAFAGDRAQIDEEKRVVDIFVRKRSDNAFHDYRIGP
jgi:hypothetical protein